jgi:2',3'-cyclic-nucleotide 2'-phosphodiesterase (5'-nucleotidase family)
MESILFMNDKNDKKEQYIDIPNGEVIEIPVLYTNDLHGELENFGKIVTLVRQKQKEGEKFLLLDAGDFASGTSVANTHKGKPMVELINLACYDAVALGEGELAFGTDGLKNILEGLKCPVLCANLHLSGGLFPGVKTYIIKELENIKFAIIGLLSPSSTIKLQTIPEIEVKDPDTVLEETINMAKQDGAEKFILLSHLGIDKDSSLAEKFDNIDLIISGHSHSYLPQPVKVKNTLIVSTGSGGKYLGSITLNIADIISMKIEKQK